MNTRTKAALGVDIIMSAAWKNALRTPTALCKRAAETAFAQAPTSRKPARNADVAIVLTSDAAVRKLNALYRGQDKATDVLSFPAWSKEAATREDARRGSVTLGDVVIAYATTARDAKAEHKPLAEHLTHLVVHGVLHLLGYDHEHDRDAATMERLEIAVLTSMGLSNPYVARPKPAKRTPQKNGRPTRKRSKLNRSAS